MIILKRKESDISSNAAAAEDIPEMIKYNNCWCSNAGASLGATIAGMGIEYPSYE